MTRTELLERALVVVRNVMYGHVRGSSIRDQLEEANEYLGRALVESGGEGDPAFGCVPTPCWIVWTLTIHGTSMRAICTEQSRADLYRRGLKDDDEIVIKAWVEKSMLNHLFGDCMLKVSY